MEDWLERNIGRIFSGLISLVLFFVSYRIYSTKSIGAKGQYYSVSEEQAILLSLVVLAISIYCGSVAYKGK